MANINIYSWDDFCYYTGSTAPVYKKGTQETFSSTDTLRFGDSFLDENDSFIGEGTGTRNDPYICGTYYEMRCATGAPNIYYLQLVEGGDDENGYHLYYYPKANKYARHDRSTTTIDFNTAQYAGVNSIYLNCHINFNGWTFENLNFNPDANFRSNCTKSGISNMILLKCHAGTASSIYDYYLFEGRGGSANPYPAYIIDSIVQVDLQSVSTNTSYRTGLLYAYYTTGSAYRCTFSVSGGTGPFALGGANSNSYSCKYYDCIFNFDLYPYCLFYDGSSSARLNNYLYSCKLTGQISQRYTGVAYPYIAKQLNNCIVDTYIYNETVEPPTIYTLDVSQAGQVTVYNSDKANCPTDTHNLIGLNSTDIKSPTALRTIGFPIGSDEINGESNV